MANIEVATRLAKRIILSNLLTNDYSIALTPLISGKHGIGKSQIAKAIAKDLNGICMTIEGGTLKEGEITGIPYQYKDENGNVNFRFLPYYVVDRIQKAEKKLNLEKKKEENIENILNGDENIYSDNNLSLDEKIDMIRLGKVKPVIIFFDEINRTDNAVFRELMNIILTKTINGYKLPWWVFVIAAMNPSTQDSLYATNEIDPAQLDRFIKIKVHEDSIEWVNYAIENNIDKTIIEFIANHTDALSEHRSELEDDEIATPSPRGWAMLDLVLKSKEYIKEFFNEEELNKENEDIREIISSKVGATVAAMYYSSLREKNKLVLAEDILEGEHINLEIIETIKNQSAARNSLTSKSIINYLKENYKKYYNNTKFVSVYSERMSTYISLLDESSKFLFVKNLAEAKAKNGVDIFGYFAEIVDLDLLNLLQLSNVNFNKIKGE